MNLAADIRSAATTSFSARAHDARTADHRSQSGPVRCLAVDDGGPVPRWDTCPDYNTCLMYAARANWPGWTCANCDLYKDALAAKTPTAWDGQCTPLSQGQRVDAAAARTAVLRALQFEAGGQMSLDELEAETGLTRHQLYKTLDTLIVMRRVRRAGRGQVALVKGEMAS